MGCLKIRAYKRLSPRVFEALYDNFTFPEGGMKHAMNDSRMVRMFVAYHDTKIVGWSAIYKGFYMIDDKVYSIGVFVDPEKRHGGIGGRLKKKAMNWAVRNKMTTFWYDGKNNWTSYLVEDCPPLPPKPPPALTVVTGTSGPLYQDSPAQKQNAITHWISNAADFLWGYDDE